MNQLEQHIKTLSPLAGQTFHTTRAVRTAIETKGYGLLEAAIMAELCDRYSTEQLTRALALSMVFGVGREEAS